MTAKLVKNQAVDLISFTGSVGGGEAIENAAAGLFKGVALELGGKDPAVIAADADINRAAKGVVWGIMFNCGQVCAGVERVYVERPVARHLLPIQSKIL